MLLHENVPRTDGRDAPNDQVALEVLAAGQCSFRCLTRVKCANVVCGPGSVVRSAGAQPPEGFSTKSISIGTAGDGRATERHMLAELQRGHVQAVASSLFCLTQWAS